MKRRTQSSRMKNLVASALGASAMAVGIFLTVSAQSPPAVRSLGPRMETTKFACHGNPGSILISTENIHALKVFSDTNVIDPAILSARMRENCAVAKDVLHAASTLYDNLHRSSAGFTQNVNFYYSLIDDQKPDTEDNRMYHNEIENVEYNGGFEERVGALQVCGTRSLIQTVTFAGRQCDKVITTSHAFYNDDATYRCESGDYGGVHKIARKNDGASHLFDPADRARHPWHGGLDPSKLENYEWVTRTYLKIEIGAKLIYSYCYGEVDRRAMGTDSGALS